MHIETTKATIAAFIGSWELISFTETLKDGRSVEPMGHNPLGLLLYTEDGFVSAQLSSEDSGQRTPSSAHRSQPAAESCGTPNSYIGYSGTFTVNETLHEVVHYPTVAHDTKLLGSALRRTFVFDMDRLLLKASTPETGELIVEAQLVWRRQHRMSASTTPTEATRIENKA